MNTKTKKQILYGEANYKNMVMENGYYVDKTMFIHLVEKYKSPVFLRPRRFGKSLWCTTLTYYYDINEKDNFGQLFGHTAVGKDPTPWHNRFMVLYNCSAIPPSAKTPPPGITVLWFYPWIFLSWTPPGESRTSSPVLMNSAI
jgi:hypothetical protein